MTTHHECAEHLRSAGWLTYAPDETAPYVVDAAVIEDTRLTLADIGAYVLLTAGFDIEGDPDAEAELARCHARLVEFGLIEGEE